MDKVSLFYERFVNDNGETILQVDLHEEELQANTKEGELQANPKEEEEKLHPNQQHITNYDSDESTIQDAQKREGQYQSELEVIPVVKKK